MLRSLYSGISGLRSHQTMLDVTGNNIANVNTTAFKSSAVRFQDTLSQMTQGAGAATPLQGGTNPAQIGLGVQVAGISTNFSQGSTQSTGKSTDMMISGDGFFVVNRGGETQYIRVGAFDFDSGGRFVTADGGIVQGWAAVNGVVPVSGGVGPVTLPLTSMAAAVETTAAGVTGNLPSDAATGQTYVRDIEVFDENGAARTVTLTFEKTAAGWDVDAADGATTASGSLTFDNGLLDSGGSLSVGDIDFDFTALTGYAELTTVSIASQNGREAGSLQSYSMSSDGTLMGSYSNGTTQPLARIALATFTNPGGLEKVGGTAYRASINSGEARYGTPGADGLGTLVGGALEMSNVDLSAEFTNLIVAQRGFQANARIITTSDEVLQELTNLKR
jgi:flagellar hook protein FlgE